MKTANSRHERALARAERKLVYIQSLIDRGRPSALTYFRLNHVCRKIEKLDRLSKKTGK
jgi:hypothetical protein